MRMYSSLIFISFLFLFLFSRVNSFLSLNLKKSRSLLSQINVRTTTSLNAIFKRTKSTISPTTTATPTSSSTSQVTKENKSIKPINNSPAKREKTSNKPPVIKKDDLGALEKQVLAKYGSNAYKNALLDEDFEDFEDSDSIGMRKKNINQNSAVGKQEIRKSTSSSRMGKFAGFNPVASTSSSSPSTLSSSGSKRKVENFSEENDEEDDDEKSNTLPSLLRGRLSRSTSSSSSTTPAKKSDDNSDENTDKYDDDDEKYVNVAIIDDDDDYYKEEENEVAVLPRSGPLNAVNGYRLRKPPPKAPVLPPTPEELAKNAAIEEAQKQKRKAKKDLDANNFFEFDFNNVTLSGAEEDKLFTTKSFSDIGITNQQVLRNLERMNIFNPTKIQELAIPELMSGQDVILQAQTGSGKTLAFLLPLLSTVNPKKRKVQAVIIAPSRELVTQIGLVGTNLFQGTGINVLSLIGGANVRNQIQRLRDDKPQIIVATPGRLAEIVFRLRKLRLGMVKAVIIDEVDNMLRDPYIGEIQTILEATPLFNRRQANLFKAARSVSIAKKDSNDAEYESKDSFELEDLIDEDLDLDINEGDGDIDEIDNDNDDDFEDKNDDDDDTFNQRLVCFASATGNDPEVKAFADRYCGNSINGDDKTGWKRVAVESTSMLPNTITHGLISSPRIKALELLKKFLNAKPEVISAIIFVNDPYRVELICDKLLEMGMIAAPLHGDTSKDDRKEILTRLRDGRVNLVVSTELAARGIDIPDLTHVINFELPTDAQHYIHRAGRCGRAGRQGFVMNFANTDTKFVIRRFGKQLGVKILDCEIRDGKTFLKQR